MSTKNNDLISVIVPIYNVEKYLKNCVESILSQSYKNLEIILVDDGSTDNCGKLADNFLKKDNRIKVIHKKNGGLSSARNAGIEKATARFLVFIDSDDEVHPDFIKTLYKNLKNSDADISICGIQKVKEKSEVISRINHTNLASSTHVFDKNLLELLYGDRADETVVAWNKLYRAELFQNIRYPEGKIHEDEFIIHLLLKKCKKLVYTDEKLYYYYERGDSITASFNLSRLDSVLALENRLEFLKDDPYLHYLTLKAYLITLVVNYSKMNDYKSERKIIKQKLLAASKEIKKSKFHTKKDALKATLASRTPKLFNHLRNIMLKLK